MTTPLQRLHQHIADEQDHIPANVIDHLFPETYVKVGFFEDGYSVWWSDCVANDWTEYYPTLSSALIRVAALIYCCEHDCTVGFASPGEFAEAAQRFFEGGVR